MTVKVEQDSESGVFFVEIPDDLMDEMGWDVGDSLTWENIGEFAALEG